MNAIINSIVISLLFCICIHQLHEKSILKAFQNTCQIISLTTFFLMICTIILRISLFLKELSEINTNYDGSILSVVQATFNFNIPTWIVMSITFILFVVIALHSDYAILQMLQINILTTLLAIAISFFLFFTIDFMDCRAYKVQTIFSSSGLDPGSAMAGSFFYGYLKIVLPSSGGTERGGILRAMETYESYQNVTIPVKKLFILIPSSSYIPPDLREFSNNWLEYAKSLETIYLDRAGVKKRNYHNTVYKLHPNGDESIKPIYVAVEGATPLKTFLEVQDKSHRYSPAYREFNKEIVRNFYNTLQNLLNENPDCRDYCELVYYQDTVRGKRINPAQVLLDHINRYIE